MHAARDSLNETANDSHQDANFHQLELDPRMSKNSDLSARRDSGNSPFLAIECPRCEDYSERRLVWLRNASVMTCDNCAAPIDLSSGANRAIIDDYIELSVRLDTEFGGR
jgi:ribosomal protein S27E